MVVPRPEKLSYARGLSPMEDTIFFLHSLNPGDHPTLDNVRLVANKAEYNKSCWCYDSHTAAADGDASGDLLVVLQTMLCFEFYTTDREQRKEDETKPLEFFFSKWPNYWEHMFCAVPSVHIVFEFCRVLGEETVSLKRFAECQSHIIIKPKPLAYILYLVLVGTWNNDPGDVVLENLSIDTEDGKITFNRQSPQKSTKKISQQVLDLMASLMGRQKEGLKAEDLHLGFHSFDSLCDRIFNSATNKESAHFKAYMAARFLEIATDACSKVLEESEL